MLAMFCQDVADRPLGRGVRTAQILAVVGDKSGPGRVEMRSARAEFGRARSLEKAQVRRPRR